MDSLLATCDNATLQCFYLAREGSRYKYGPNRNCTEEVKHYK